jgi:hypothetical protein
MYLRPYLIANGYPAEEVKNVCIWYDPSLVATRNDRAADADSGFDKMAVSYDTWRRAHGFSEADAPDPTELALRLVLNKGMITPELTESMLAAVAPEVMNNVRKQASVSTGAPISPELDQILQNATTETPAEAPAEPAAPITPAEATPPLAEPEA